MWDSVPKNRRFGYARITLKSKQDLFSSQIQIKKSLEEKKFLQHDVLETNIRIEILSPNESPSIWNNLISNELRENDLLVISQINHCVKNRLDYFKLHQKLVQKSIRFIALDLPYSDDMRVNTLIRDYISSLISFEKKQLKKNQQQGILAARKEGKYRGRKTVIDKKLIDQVQYLKENKNLSITQISEITGRARTTIYKILKTELNYIPYNRLVKKEFEM